jgi:cell fate (sporulation/competence/biofilm development) regulator YlbF (YheA/YmcA/DUF963 family)
MKHPLVIFILLALLVSCSPTRDYLSRSNEDKALADAVKYLSKNPGDSGARHAVSILYPKLVNQHQDRIEAFEQEKDLSRWDKLSDEYNALQKMYETVSRDATASALVHPVSRQNELTSLKQRAAGDYYDQATLLLQNPGRDDSKKAYMFFKKADHWVPGFKDAKSKMNEAFQNAIVNVVIKPVEDNSFYFNTGWGNTGYNYSNEYFQQTLVRDLGGKNATRYPAKFYTDWDARRDNVKPDWVVELVLRNLDIPQPSNYTYSRNVSKSVEVSRDTSGNVLYQNVYATVYITRQSFTARVQMDVNITDANTRKYISSNTYREDYSWMEEHASFSGDSRALDGSDWQLVNNNNYNEPNKEQALSELYRKLYPQVRNCISYAVDW